VELAFNKSKIKGKRWAKKIYEREMRKLEEEKLSHFMWYKCHEMGHLAMSCPNKEELKMKKEEERLKHVKCFKFHTWGYFTSMCPNKNFVEATSQATRLKQRCVKYSPSSNQDQP
jgi:hypothetical protein